MRTNLLLAALVMGMGAARAELRVPAFAAYLEPDLGRAGRLGCFKGGACDRFLRSLNLSPLPQ